MFFVYNCNVWLDCQDSFVCQHQEVPQDFSSVILRHLFWCLSSGPGKLQSVLSADVPVHYLRG